MRALLLVLCASTIVLSGCGKQGSNIDAKDPGSGSTSTGTDTTAPTGTDTSAPATSPAAPASQKLFMAAAEKLKTGDAKGCDALLTQAEAAALKENDLVDYLHIRETHAKLKVSQKDMAGAQKLLEDEISKYDSNKDPQITNRLDGLRYTLSAIYRETNQKSKSDDIFKRLLAKVQDAEKQAKAQKDHPAYLHIRETEARMRDQNGDKEGAIKVLQDEIKAFGSSADSATQTRLDGLKFYYASLLAKGGKTAEAEKIYKDTITAAKAEKPANPKRAAFAMHSYAEFLKFTKRTKEAEDMEKQAITQIEIK